MLGIRNRLFRYSISRKFRCLFRSRAKRFETLKTDTSKKSDSIQTKFSNVSHTKQRIRTLSSYADSHNCNSLNPNPDPGFCWVRIQIWGRVKTQVDNQQLKKLYRRKKIIFFISIYSIFSSLRRISKLGRSLQPSSENIWLILSVIFFGSHFRLPRSGSGFESGSTAPETLTITQLCRCTTSQAKSLTLEWTLRWTWYAEIWLNVFPHSSQHLKNPQNRNKKLEI